MFKKSLIAVASLVAAVGTAQACSTLIIGKNVSETGNIIVAHNEDNGGRLFNLQHYIPAAKHKKGEMLKFEKFAAEIPQVEETLGFYWTQNFVPDGSSFADGFLNDAGVIVATNWCGEIFEQDRQKVKDGGIGYGIRRLIAERAHSAREGVEIATKLLKEYGYFHDGRTYTIADANEAWQLAIHQGNSWVAHRIQDDEVVYIPIYPLAGPAKGTAFMDGATATKEHFAGTPSMFDYRADFAPHAVFSASNNAIDYLRADELAKRTKLIHEQEAAFMADRDAVTKKAASLKGEERTKFLHDYNEAAYQKVLGVIQAENARLMPNKVEILSKVVRADHEDDVQFVLYGTKGHEVLGANMSATRAGMSANQLNSTRQWKNFAPATKMEYKDVNGDGLMDVVFTFKSKELAKGAVPGAVMDLWLYTQINGHRVTGFDAVPVETDKVKKSESRNGKGLL